MNLSTMVFRKVKFIRNIGGIKRWKNTVWQVKSMERAFKNYNPENGIDISSTNLEIFRKAFRKFIWQQNKEAELWKLFLETKLIPLKVEKVSDKQPIVICVVKNDLNRMKQFILHYTALGFKKFVIIDNDSTDGTREWLVGIDNVDLYLCETVYTTLNREAWINVILAHYGFNRWYLVVDSDELFVYPQCESKDINEFISSVQSNKMRRVRSVLLDMYSKSNLFEETEVGGDIQGVYKYFDKVGYSERTMKKYEEILGGPRTRVCKKWGDENARFLLTKHPLFFFVPGDIHGSSHFSFPYDDNYNLPCLSALLHYKFMQGDMNKYRERAKSGNFASGSAEYKTYVKIMDSEEKYSFFDESISVEYKNSSSLSELSFIQILPERSN